MNPPVRLRAATTEETVAVFCDSFADYPVMRYVLGASPDYDERLRELITLFVMGRVLRGDPLLAMDSDGEAVACATLTRPDSTVMTGPGEATATEELDRLAGKTWASLGEAARGRYSTFVEAANATDVEQPHFHVNMIGVVSSHLGRGLARPLLEEAHARSAAHPESEGVSLGTELPKNVTLYQHFGYEIVAHLQVDEGIETWGFFRPDASAEYGGLRMGDGVEPPPAGNSGR